MQYIEVLQYWIETYLSGYKPRSALGDCSFGVGTIGAPGPTGKGFFNHDHMH